MALFKKTSPEEKFAGSRLGQALAAYERGHAFFQLRAVTSEVNEPVPASTPAREFNRTDLLGQIEEIGWRLEHASWVWVEMGMKGDSGSSRIAGEVTGIYLFRRAD
jgi:hypothetical protein